MALGLPATGLLMLVAGMAGFIDAIAGGGGLLTVPALALAGLDPVGAVATNKLSGTFGTASATFAFARAGHLDFKPIWPLGMACAGGAIAGAALLTLLPRAILQAAMPIVLIVVAGYFALSPRFGDIDGAPRLSRLGFSLGIAPLVAFYDGIFGPGAGSLYMIGFVGLLGYGAVRATAHTKFANFASNLASLLTLAASGHIVWQLGLLMGAAQYCGARLGAHATLRAGARLIRPLLILICCALAVRIALTPGNPIADLLRDLWRAAGVDGSR